MVFEINFLETFNAYGNPFNVITWAFHWENSEICNVISVIHFIMFNSSLRTAETTYKMLLKHL